jgi:hypothetical protein
VKRVKVLQFAVTYLVRITRSNFLKNLEKIAVTCSLLLILMCFGWVSERALNEDLPFKFAISNILGAMFFSGLMMIAKYFKVPGTDPFWAKVSSSIGEIIVLYVVMFASLAVGVKVPQLFGIVGAVAALSCFVRLSVWSFPNLIVCLRTQYEKL